MELETLEVLLDINTARVEQSLENVLPKIEAAMNRIQQMSGNSMDRTEKNMNIEKGANNFSKQLDKMTQLLEKSLNNFERSTKQTSETVGDNFSSGIRKARPKVTKEIDAMVNEINAKMGQAKAAQEKVAYLKSQRQSASNKGDTGQVVKYDEQIARAQAQMTKFQDQAKGMGNTIKRELDAVPSSLDNITKGMSQNEAQIEAMRKRLRTLKAEYNDQRVPTGSFSSGFKNYEDTPQSLKTSGEIQKQSIKMNKLISDNDRLQKEYAQTEDRADALRKALQRVNSALGQSSIQTGNASSGASMTGTGLKQSERAVSKYGGVFNRMSNAVSHGFGSVGNGLRNSLGFIGKFGSLFSSNSNKVTAGTNRMTGSTNAFGQSMKYLLPSLVVYQLLGGAITKMASGMMSALKTNDQFSASLNQIKVNLMTAFYPIYTAILPALNALMSTVAQLTGQLASFIAMLFGTTYDAAKQGASGLYDNIQALNDTGSSANKANEKVKKLQRSLMGFDQINKLTMNTDDAKKEDPAPGIDFGSATGNYSTPKWMKDIQNILKDFFKPFQDAWKNQGQRVIDAWKYALGEVIGLASAIGKSFMEVWTNGTGQKFIENILILLADVLGIIGDIAGAFRRAWEDNGRGTRLIQSIFDMWNRILELLHEIAVAFRDAWNDGRGESIAANILEIYTNIFNTIGNIAEQLKKAWKEGKVGESIFGTILDAVDDLLGNINDMTKATEEWAKNLDFTPLLKAIDGLFKSIRPILKNVGDGLEWLYKNVLLPLASFYIEDYVPKYFDYLSAALDVLNQVIEIFKPIFKWFWDVVIVPLAQVAKFLIIGQIELLTKGLEILAGVLEKVANAVKNPKKAIGELKDVIDDKFGSIMTFVSDTWGNVQKWTSDTWANAKKTVSEKASDIWKNVSGRWSDIKKNTKETWDTFSTDVSNKARTAKDNASKRLQELRTNISDRWSNVKKNTVEKWNEIQDKVTTAAGNAKSKASIAFSNLKTSMGGSFETMKKNASEAFDKITGWATGLGSKIGKGLSNGVKSVKEGAGKIFNGMVGVIGKGVNGVISGINWVLNKVGAGSSALKKWTIPTYAKGTGYHPGGMALVNDGLGSNYQEAYRTPDGRTGIFPAQRNLMVNLPKGTSVLSGPKTAAMYGVPAYANGIGEWFKEKWNGAKEIASDIWSYASNPKKLLNAAISKFVNLKGAVEPALSMAKGSVGTIAEGSYEWFKSKFNAGYEAQNSSFDGSMGSWGVYKYLYDIARKTVDRYPGMRITSGFRPGDPHSHGKHQAIDVAYPASMNGSSKYFAPANWVFDNFASKVAYVITQGKVRDRKGMSGTGSSGSWVKWPANDHYDHLHINGSLGASDIDKNASFGASGGAAVAGKYGSSVERWRSTVNSALNKLGIYSLANANRTLYQMKTESNGNPNAINNWDINAKNGTPSKGLMQVIDPTFRAYARSPYNKNIWDPMSNILASMRYALSRYGSLAAAYRGVGYENGGLVTQDGLYRMGEGNKKEMVIPLERPQRAAELIQQAVEYLGLDMFNSSLVLPEMFTEPTSVSSISSSFNNQSAPSQSMGTDELYRILLMLLNRPGNGGGDNPTPTRTEVNLKVDRATLATVVLEEIKKIEKQTGVNPVIGK
ncbi:MULTISPECIES: transglycosylase SLT domain-containing protein [unclassified Enterococcus]|uniref:transglycosylase SLT domain-containing protein n=1 Tax=unclassified Enterococcus TaxID=2608891 RepID=UPI00259B165A|nr:MULTISPECIES: transglycosylase SLT domain-containing protein [unclassified Enterococcus]MDO0919899.1 transglycosylase SLT domain-containing protein [Enterococcus sp. B1E2]WIV14299.1 transglycosylase SLT domain-containing protein [Enterococcus sp. FZMF]